MAVMGRESWKEWIDDYSKSHQHPINRMCHSVGIPMIAASVVLALPSLAVPMFWPVPVTLFVVGWILQFIGHAFEGKPPEFFSDFRFLFVGLRWWMEKVAGRA